MPMLKSVFYLLSQNERLNQFAQKYSDKLGVNAFVAGTNLKELDLNTRMLNDKGIAVTIDHLGEFVRSSEEALEAKRNILDILDYIYEEQLDAHMSIKLTQLGLDVDEDVCKANIIEILNKAQEYRIFINIDMEDYKHVCQSWKMIESLKDDYDCVGTVIQATLHRTREDITQHSDMRLRIVKGAYKENEDISFSKKKDIDAHYLMLAKEHLLNGNFTSIATHDHKIIQELQQFIIQHNIAKTSFEFQFLYGFRTDLQESLSQDGYRVCVYMPYGVDWYGYFMRRLAERPKNIMLVIKENINRRRVEIK
ncbi:proline dehydrogenase family protein [Mammaliicoccus sp. Dog046]|uniref:proline dehydrogenase family protein n=1 Tax=Mammaliicoccus sp. Dog046 TaxID=3034233 RepID=UPI002B261DDE|nr:proline dehydrogenase family protein [Mammaliicoccus sp. Dog046]WQK85266.1 proline dehydrogenase family protein [Mammaliicoccus sp. Dog046]